MERQGGDVQWLRLLPTKDHLMLLIGMILRLSDQRSLSRTANISPNAVDVVLFMGIIALLQVSCLKCYEAY
jgi:hypothetical protein